MRKSGLKYLLKGLVIFTGICLIILISNHLMGQPGPPPHGSSGDQPLGGSAPIGSGLLISLVLGIGYGARKVYYLWTRQRDDE